MSEHTPTPWEVVDATEHRGPYIVGPYGDIADLYAMSNPMLLSTRNGGESRPVQFMDAEGNAAFIVKAVNCHDELVAALEAFRLRPDAIVASQGDTIVLRIPIAAIQQAAAAIAKASAP